ncbi:LysR substrate-binding domain-containing protein [Paludibacterium yongneupense]|uniref:LysR substrate-binding domain-containing protein n=1 Tax=Paludibacterium yongneupense TaxID=400061 RepID=UPI000425E848|nr:LysR substrate-binding domain-containing protein [Paludibacterium yongneupense]
MPRLPSLAALRTFDAVARHLHFRRAAEELAVSHAAVSQHIRQLEQDLGVLLFQRSRAGVEMTAEGRTLAGGAVPAFDLLRNTVAAVHRGRSGAAPSALRVSLLPSLATCWLYPRVPGWPAEESGIELELETSTRIVAFGAAASGPDAAIRHGAGDWPGLTAERLCGDWLLAAISPALLARLGGRGLAPERLFESAPLLRHAGVSWPAWFAQVGVSPQSTRTGPLFRDAGVMVEACKAGQGICLTRRTLLADALAAGTLACAHPAALATEWGNYLVYPAGDASPAVRLLRDWLLQQMRHSGFHVAP